MIVHFFRFGQTPCMMEGQPCNWPAGHKWSSKWTEVTCPHCQRGRNIAPTFHISMDGKSITCLRCKVTSHNPEDVAQHYCGRCHVHHDDIWPPARLWWVENPDVPPEGVPLTTQAPPNDEPKNLYEWLWRTRYYESSIFVAEHGKPVSLSTLPPERWAFHVSRWLKDGILPVRVLEQSKSSEKS